jgi:hypothetical protein
MIRILINSCAVSIPCDRSNITVRASDVRCWQYPIVTGAQEFSRIRMSRYLLLTLHYSCVLLSYNYPDWPSRKIPPMQGPSLAVAKPSPDMDLHEIIRRSCHCEQGAAINRFHRFTRKNRPRSPSGTADERRQSLATEGFTADH